MTTGPPLRTRIKICGITSPDAARAAVEAGADAIGLVFAPGTPRCVTPTQAREIAAAVEGRVMVVAVHRNPPWPPDATAAAALDLTPLQQMHGDEDEALLARIGRKVFRGFAFDPEQVRRWDRCEHVAKLLIDGPTAGSGAAFDHGPLAAMMPEITKPVILAGGLTPANVADAVRAVRPHAVDVSSGVESAPGVKDARRVRAFCEAVRETDA